MTIEQNDSKKMQKGNYFKILSWNIDGLDSSAKEQRTIGVANKINKYFFNLLTIKFKLKYKIIIFKEKSQMLLCFKKWSNQPNLYCVLI